jgi:hypothetical protein
MKIASRTLAALFLAAALLLFAGVAFAAPAIVRGALPPASHYTDGKCSSCHGAPSRSTPIPAGHYDTVCTNCHAVTNPPPPPPPPPPTPSTVGTIPSSCTVVAPSAAVGYNALVALTGTVNAEGSAILASPYVSLQRRATLTGAWATDGAAAWNAGLGVYTTSRRFAGNTHVRFHFAGDATRAPSDSPDMLVRVKAGLGKPSAPKSVKRGVKFTVRVAFTSARIGVTRFSFMRRSGTRWVGAFAKTARLATLRPVRYAATLSLPTAGRWAIRAAHVDANHASTTTGPIYITVTR